MSYCRWSSDDWACDVYVYESNEGYVTHIAGSRYEHPDGMVCPHLDVDDFAESYAAQMQWLDQASTVPLGLPRDGETTVVDTPGECADTLLALKEMGYHVPQYAIDELREEPR